MSDWDLYAVKLSLCAEIAGITEQRWAQFMESVRELNDHNSPHACHSLRVGLYAFGLAQHERQADLKYDVGKCDILNEVIDHPAFGPEQMAVMRAYPQLGFDRLKSRYLFTAFVAGLHHKFQPEGYGIDLDEATPFPLSPEAEGTIIRMTRLVMICDYFDALTTRAGPNSGNVFETMNSLFPDSVRRIDWLLDNQE